MTNYQPVPTRRRSSVIEEAAEGFQSMRVNSKKSRKRSFGEVLKEIKTEIYNPNYREFLSRDAKSWFKLSLFYAIFFTCLALFFSLLLFIFYKTIDPIKPTYYNENSVMNTRGVNPGLGFRPHLDPESELIKLDQTNPKEIEEKYIDLFKLFLKKYEERRNQSFSGFNDKNVTFDYREIINNTPCSVENNFGFKDLKPCVAVKLNKIFEWV